MSSGWGRSTVGEITSRSDYGLSCGLSKDPAGVPILRMGNLLRGRVSLAELKYVPTERVAEKDLLHRGDLLLNRTNSPDLVGKVGLFTSSERVTFASYLFRLRADPSKANAEWLAQLLGSPTYQGRLRELATPGVSQVNINREVLRSLAVPLPSIPEQRNIAAVLCSMDDALEATQAIIDQLQVVKKAMMAALLTRGMPGRHTRFKESLFGSIPETWETARLGEITDRVRTPVDVVPAGLYREIGVRSHGKGVFHKDAVQGDSLGAKRVFHIEPSCLVVNIVFAWEGAVAATSTNESGMIASHRFPLLRPKPKVADLHYLRLLFQTKRGIELLGSISPGGAGRNKTLGMEAFLRLELPLPPLGEQQAVGRAIVATETRIAEEQAYRHGLWALKSALMSVLLTGELRVTPEGAS